jgi:hypothetical protein
MKLPTKHVKVRTHAEVVEAVHKVFPTLAVRRVLVLSDKPLDPRGFFIMACVHMVYKCPVNLRWMTLTIKVSTRHHPHLRENGSIFPGEKQPLSS